MPEYGFGCTPSDPDAEFFSSVSADLNAALEQEQKAHRKEEAVQDATLGMAKKLLIFLSKPRKAWMS